MMVLIVLGIILLSHPIAYVCCLGIVTPAGCTPKNYTFFNSIQYYSQFWNISATFPVSLQTARSTYICEALSSTEILVAGGQSAHSFGLKSTEIVNLHTGTVTNGAPLNTGRKRMGHAIICGVVYACGGTDGYMRALNTCEYYKNSKWYKLTAPMKQKRMAPAMVATDKGLLVIGGQNESDHYLETTEYYSFDKKAWSNTMAPMSQARGFHGAAILNGYVYVCGGWQMGSWLKSCEKYSFVKNVWSHVADLNVARSNTNMLVHGGRLYMMGGTMKGNKALKSIEVYDPHEGVWKLHGQMDYAAAWISSVVLLGG